MSEVMDAIFDLRHANEFTDIENTAIVYVLRGWLRPWQGSRARFKPETMRGRLRPWPSISRLC